MPFLSLYASLCQEMSTECSPTRAEAAPSTARRQLGGTTASGRSRQRRHADTYSAGMQIPNAVCSHTRNLLGFKNRKARDKMFQLSNHQRASNDRVQVGAFPLGVLLSAGFAVMTDFAGYCRRRWCRQIRVNHPADSKQLH